MTTPDPNAHLITLNIGLGRDSIAMLCLLVEGKLVANGRTLTPADVDAVIFSDTGAEWSHTYAQIRPVKRLCKRYGLRFLWLRKPVKTGPKGWRANLRERGSRALPAWCSGDFESIEDKARRGAYHRRLPIVDEYMRFGKIAVTVSASCTDNHKVGPIRRVIDDLARARFGVGNRSWSYRVRAKSWPKHWCLIGIAADEASRAIDTGRPAYELPVYPLVEMGITKDGEAEILERHGFGGVQKSGCYMCPYQPVGWYWVLRETDPVRWRKVVDYEAAALAANPKMHVVGSRPLAETVERWRRRNPTATFEAVLDKSYSRCAAWVDERQQPLFADGGAA